MKLDVVHDLQSVYRKVVNATSRPGMISNLSDEALSVENIPVQCAASIWVLALTLLDQEVTFKVYSAQAEKASRAINQLTYAKPVEINEADFIFVLSDAEEGSLEEAIELGKHGTLMNPHNSATIIVEAENVNDGVELLLSGPGIQTSTSVNVCLTGDWIASRNQKNREYPLGIDLMIIDKEHQLLSLPRTTQIIENRVVV
ncbi:phosphonate C-P lyase system protein PhnH [Mesobacillus foraminis]|uniref:Alpha-D-ribose 1-methylphosphonate 5-triphosphate synthase subunit PhnH n=1 Tax=Mesobacillus foraminis TaxID=279826 RepID=A0A4R2B739_9BACI|nr:phosphonate C-P lyase system protein PhnH [Mesobacillus foraminis]TCN21214.1 alpha-D-ribose 1-methylphosphonate 5-triphosphate synthase subunit PhnH [Mesobacillus foraminis]